MDYHRPDTHKKRHHDRAEELITHLAAEFVVRESNGTSLITATRTVLAQKGDRATIYVTVFPEEMAKNALEFLNRNTDEFREYLKSHARMRDLPRIAFEIDYGELNRQHLDELGKNI